MNKICLIVIYNHNYEKNIPVINRIYEGRFSSVYHIMPFYQGSDPRVIGVYESSYQYSGYLAQAYKKISSDDYSHYVVVADDMILNPELNESNIVSRLKLGSDSAYITEARILNDESLLMNRSWALAGVTYMESHSNATEWRKFMPSLDEARVSFDRIGLDWHKAACRSWLRFLSRGQKTMRDNPYKQEILLWKKGLARFPIVYRALMKRIRGCHPDLIYPLATAFGCADFFVLPASAATNFFHYCGCFAAMRQFVEIAIPTALVLSCKRIVTLSDIELKSDPPGEGGQRLSNEIEKTYEKSYLRLVKGFPEDYLYIHPIKISRWEDLP